MLSNEKEQLLHLFADQRRWCQGSEAKDARGDSVHFDDPAAVAWDLTGAVCRLFGWNRATELFHQLDEHIHKTRRNPLRSQNPEIASMAMLQDRNDEDGTTFENILEWLRTMPVRSEKSNVK